MQPDKGLEVPPGDPIDKAIAAQAQAPNMAAVKFQLPGGREAQVAFPIPITPDDIIRITNGLTGFFLQQFEAEHPTGPAAAARSRILIPQ